MQLSPIGQACLMAREGRRLTAYLDTANPPRWTIGIGCTTIDGRPVARGDTITSAECDALFSTTLAHYVAAVAKVAPPDLPDHEADALGSFCYNIGIAGFAGSTVAKLLRSGSYGGIPAAMLMWDKPASIKTRRQAEANQFATPYTTALPKPTSTGKPIAVPVMPTAPAVTTASGVPVHPAQAGPVLAPVILPPATGPLARFGAWIDYVFAPPSSGPDLAARG